MNNNKYAVITGSSSGIGLALTKLLLELNYNVFGISRTSPKIDDNNYTHIFADLTSKEEVIKVCNNLKNQKIHILINNAGFGKFEPHEELSYKTILDMTMLNLTVPMLLSNALLRTLKKNDGYIINILSIEAIKSSKFAGVYSATKSGLKAFGDSLFEETRKSNLSITNIIPDMTESNFYEQLRFDVSDKENEKLLVEDITQALKHILTMRKGAVIQTYTIRSLNFGIIKKKN